MYSLFLRSEPYVLSLLKTNVRSPYSCHELFGFDIMLDENLKPWILEVNISPRWDTLAHTHAGTATLTNAVGSNFRFFCSLHSNTALDVSIKGQMVKDLLNLAAFHLPRKGDAIASCSSASSCTRRYQGRCRMSLFNCGNAGGKKTNSLELPQPNPGLKKKKKSVLEMTSVC